MHVKTTDPKWEKPIKSTILEKVLFPYMKDERDLIFIRVTALITLIVLPLAFGLFMSPPWLVGLLAVPYIGFVFLMFGGRFGLMLHAVGHRPIYKRKYRFLQTYIPFVLGPFLGHTPTSFAAHHMWMHHAENNMLGDGSTTLPYVRDSFVHFLHYFIRFLIMGPIHLVRYLTLRGRNKTCRRYLMGEVAWLVLACVAVSINWAAALVVFIVPMIMMRWLMMAGNFAQHAFVDIDNADDPFANSTNLTNTNYNHKSYNDGYHIIHHLRPAMHWTDMAQYYEDNVQDFVDADALVFDGIRDNQHVWFLLMTKNYDTLAEHMVNFHGRTHEEKVAYIKNRTKRQLGEIPAIFRLESKEDMQRTKRNTRISVKDALATA